MRTCVHALDNSSNRETCPNKSKVPQQTCKHDSSKRQCERRGYQRTQNTPRRRSTIPSCYETENSRHRGHGTFQVNALDCSDVSCPMTYSLRYLAMLGENGEMDLGRLGERCKHWSSTVQNISTDHCECLEPSKRDSEPAEVQICQAEQNHKAGFNTSQQLLHQSRSPPTAIHLSSFPVLVAHVELWNQFDLPIISV
jgi:hypothetical protein